MDHQANLYDFEDDRKDPQPFSWSKYNESQTKEKIMFVRLLSELCNTLELYTLRDKVFVMGMKTYLNTSSRRLISELIMCERANMIRKVPHFNTVLNYFNDENLTRELKYLIELSALPLAQLERKFAIDSSGIGAHQYEPWRSARSQFGEHRKYKKVHCVYGVLSNVVVSCRVTDGTAADSPRFQELLQRAADNFTVEEIMADLAYSSRDNLEFSSSLGSIPYIPFKSNATGRAGTSKTWYEMYRYFKGHPEEFLKHYHKRSNAETGFYMIKTKFGEFVRCKNKVAQENEIYCKVLAHNICCLIQEVFLQGIEVNFNSCKERFI